MLFVTGMLRSGTTLLEKLLAAHPDVSLLSQPFPFVFIEAKRAFLAAMGRGADPYPLNDLFLERGYSAEDFERFLDSYRPSAPALLDTFRAMATYSGQSTRFAEPDVRAAVESLEDGDFAHVLEQLYRRLAVRPSAKWTGGKETICEEFLPYLLARGAAGVLILRDPRDMLASLNHGRGEEFTGTRKPTLFNLRQWRKSVAFALHLQRQPTFRWLRYEDLARAPVETLNRLTPMLGVAPFEPGAFATGVRDQRGGVWQGNSSHASARSLDASSVDTYKRVLPPEVARFAEAACLPELRCLGYPASIGVAEAREIIRAFVDPYEDARENLRDYYADPERPREEIDRLDGLGGSMADDYYVFHDVREALRHAVSM